MCGIAGIARVAPIGVSPEVLARMAGALRHRGPDGYGFYASPRVGLAHVRLSIIDLARGAQPLGNEDGQIWIVYNGEVYNYRELRPVLEAHGHVFSTDSDTEVLVHAYEQWGPAMLGRLNGQFAFAIYDRRDESVFLARDRFGVRPLFYAQQPGRAGTGGALYFASEAKALFATGEVDAAPDYAGIDEVFTLWAARPPRTPFRGVSSLEPGSWAVWKDGVLRVRRYYDLEYPEAGEESPDAVAQLDDLMRTGVDLRMRADVPVGGYLSGGLDSSITCALATASSPYQVRTFSVTFDDPRFDESGYQRAVAAHIHSQHAVQSIGGTAVAEVFPDVVWHAETPLVRSAPAPMYLLSRLTRDAGIKVVLTGEGADELFLGYDLFKETVVREFCLRQPKSTRRLRLFDRLYPYLGGGGEFWSRFFLQAGFPDDPLFSHLPRIRLTSRIKDFYAPAMRDALGGWSAEAALRDSLPPEFKRWSRLNRAAYLEMVTLLSPYLLSSQGDRMGMAHGIEGRFPFLDHRLFEFAAALPERSKLRRLREKDILRRWANNIVPPAVRERSKQPYRAPDAPAFFADGHLDYVTEALDAPGLREAGVFDPAAVEGLVRRCRTGKAT
ncbi:MAG TPA: asparagine synthase (glutamine-hydrolyzing), partial [Gemmatimonadales bacterium]|nr:asparagine synthase (glutamine-hydrolyzing) [Gemmatimonadales bacterium]